MTEKRIRIILDSKQANQDAKKLDSNVVAVGKSADQSQLKMNRLAFAIKSALAGGAITKAITTLISAQREFDKLNASLVTATGSIDNAGLAFDAIQSLAEQTPYSVDQVTRAFIQLRNLGLDPSEKAIISYGNTAAAMGKDLSQLIEAVADASTGEFERLKEFGIKARTEGDKISLTFQGTTTKIQNSAAAVEKYLQDLGNNQFAGAVDARMKTLDGTISNLGDSWAGLVRSLASGGFSDTIQSGAATAITALNELTAMVASGQLPAYFDSWGGSFGGFANDIAGLSTEIIRILDELAASVGGDSKDISGLLSDAFINAGPNIRAFIQLLTVEVAGAIDKVVAYSQYLKTAVTDFSFDSAATELEANLARINAVRFESIDLIIAENKAAADSVGDQIEAAKQLRVEYENAKKAAPSDALGQFKIKAEGSQDGGGASEAEIKKQEKIIASARETTAALERELNYRRQVAQIYRDGELEDTASQYEKAMAMQRVNEQTKLAENEARYAEDLERRQERFLASLENDALEEEQKVLLRQEFDNQLLLSAALFEQEKTSLLRQGANDRAAVEKAEMQSRLDNAKALGGALMSLGQGQSKKVFQIGKTLALAQASAALPSAVIQSFQNGGGYPWGLIPAAAMLATGLKNINTIKKAGSGLGGGSGGSVPSISLPSGGGSSMPTPPTSATASAVTAPTQQPTQYAVTFQSDGVFTGEWVNNQLKELKKSGGVIASNDS